MPQADLAATLRIVDQLEARLAAVEQTLERVRRVARLHMDTRSDVAAAFLIKELAEPAPKPVRAIDRKESS